MTIIDLKYAECLENFRKSYIPPNDPYISNKRFREGSNALSKTKRLNEEQVINFSFDVLDIMSQHPCTLWNIGFDITNLCVYYRTKPAGNIRFFRFDYFDFSCTTPMLELDVNRNYSGDVLKHFTEYSRTNNLNLMREAF